MKPKVILLSRDLYLARKIELELTADVDFVRAERPETLSDGDVRALCLWDLDDFPAGFPSDAVLLSRERNLPYENRSLPLPLPIGAVRALLTRRDRENMPRLRLSDADKSATLDGEKISFSDTEYALLSLLCRAQGDAVARERISGEVFSEENSQSLINVYIHYLREKLEKNGEKIIKSERGSGYRIDRRFLSVQDATGKEE